MSTNKPDTLKAWTDRRRAVRIMPGELAILVHTLGPIKDLLFADPNAGSIDEVNRLRAHAFAALTKLESYLRGMIESANDEEQRAQFVAMYESLCESSEHAVKEGGRMLGTAMESGPPDA